MNSILTIATHEFRRLLVSPFAWLVLASVQFILALFFYLLLSRYLESAGLYAGRGITAVVVIGMLQIAGLVMLILSPFITMRSFSEEFRGGTIKLLFSSPVSITALVLGKFCGLALFYLCLLLLIALMPLSLLLGTTLDFGVLFSGLVALFLLFSSFIAIGLFISSLSATPALAAVGSFVVLISLWLIHIVNDTGNIYVEAVLNYLSLQKHFNALLSGAFSSSDMVYYLLLTSLFLVLSIWRLDRLRTHK